MKRSGGFTLVEVIVGMAVIAISAVASLEFFKYCYGSFIVPDKLRLEAVNYARSSLEARYMEEYDSPALNNTTGFVVDSTPDWKLDGHSAQKSHSVTTKNPGTGQEYKVVSTKVEWTR